jgi:hypothetical protein
MNAPAFTFPIRHLPFLETADWSGSPSPLLRFKQQGTDKGLANATRFYWLAKRVTMNAEISVDVVAYLEVDPPTDPRTFTYSNREFSFTKTYTQYDADAAAVYLYPAAAADDSGIIKPHERAEELDDFGVGAISWLSVQNDFTPADDAIDAGTNFTATRIEFNAAEDRWCLALVGGCAMTGLATSGDYEFNTSVYARLEPWDYSLGEYEVFADFAYPDIFDDTHAPKLVYLRPGYFSPDDSEWVPFTTFVSWEFSVEYWTFA